jgi:D-sedoheptulose 7-phosphate isomerase
MTIDEELSAHMEAIRDTIDGSARIIEELVAVISSCFQHGGKILICGNGGSAADAQHFAAEFMNRMKFDRRPWPALALTTDSSVLTSIANDSAYEEIFSRQVLALGRPGDVLIGISTSGKSEAVRAALCRAKGQGLTAVGFTGETGRSRMSPDCDLVLAVASDDTARIQEVHEFIYHYIAGAVEGVLAGNASTADTVNDQYAGRP